MFIYPSSYVNSSLLLRFLIIVTGIFLLVFALLYWQQLHKEAPESTAAPFTVKNFFSITDHTEVTKSYPYGAKIITDIETYPAINNLFFANPIPELSDTRAVLVALKKVKAERGKATSFSDSHVQHTSYYVGNLLVWPEVTLHELLSASAHPATAQLLESALADMRSGVVKIQNYFNTLPPSLYDKSITSSVYFVTPSFPSLTVTEVLTVFFILAQIDPVNARVYESQAHQYVNQVLTSGGQFRIDVEYAIKLATLGSAVFTSSPAYAPLFASAKKEWPGVPVDTSNITIIKPRLFIPDFPYNSNFTLKQPVQFGYVADFPKETLTGSLRMSLEDNRLPSPRTKLYEYNFDEGSVLPYAVNILSREYPAIKSAQRQASYEDKDTYVFVADDQEPVLGREDLDVVPSNLIYRNGNEVISLTEDTATQEEKITRINPRLSNSRNHLIFSEVPTRLSGKKDLQQIKLATLIGNRLESVELMATGTSPDFAFLDSFVLFNKVDGIYSQNIATKAISKILNTPLREETLHSNFFSYDEGTKLLSNFTNYFDTKLNQPISVVMIYRLSEDELNIRAEQVLEFSLIDANVYDVETSPGGRYVAFMITETPSDRSGRLLIFDTNSGIVSNEIDLASFAPQSLSLDEWTTF